MLSNSSKTGRGVVHLPCGKRLALGFALLAVAVAVPFPRADAAESLDALSERATKLGEGWADILDGDTDSCDVKAGKLSKYADDKAALVKETMSALKAASKKATADQNKAVQTKYESRQEATEAKTTDGLTKCRGNAKVTTQYMRWLKLIREAYSSAG
jgi:hypothetical protein